MGFNFKSIMGGKKANQAADVTQVKKGGQTTDNIISQAVKDAGNISSMTLSKKEQEQLFNSKNKVPFQVTALKYLSLTVLAVTIVAGLLLKADVDPRNNYLSVLGLSDNTGSKFVKYSQDKNKLEQQTTMLKAEIDSIRERSKAFDDTSDSDKIALLVPEVSEVEAEQKRWFSEVVEVEDELTGQLKEVRKYGLIDSFNEMIEYFEDKQYQPRFFNQKNRDESINRSEPEVCNVANNKLTPSELALKRQYENAGKCFTSSTLIMANEIDIRGLSITANGANVNVMASDLLSRVFTLSSEFVAMMNSFPFYKGAAVTSFTRRELSAGGDSSEIALRLNFQEEDEEDEYDEYLSDLTQWQENWR